MTKIIAHRGASGYAPENTIPAFIKAIEMGSDGIELDVHMSKDGHIIVMHDDRVDRTSNGMGRIADMTLKELKRLDNGYKFGEQFKGTAIPTLQEVFDLVKNWDGFINIEIKGGFHSYPGIEEKIAGMIKAYHYEDRIIFSSFNHQSMHRIKEYYPGLKTGLLYSDRLFEPWKYAKIVGADALHPPYIYVDGDMVQGCRKDGVIINTWTVNDKHAMEAYIRLGVDGVITNYPDVAIEVRRYYFPPSQTP